MTAIACWGWTSATINTVTIRGSIGAKRLKVCRDNILHSITPASAWSLAQRLFCVVYSQFWPLQQKSRLIVFVSSLCELQLQFLIWRCVCSAAVSLLVWVTVTFLSDEPVIQPCSHQPFSTGINKAFPPTAHWIFPHFQTLEMIVCENPCRSAVSEILRPARQSPTTMTKSFFSSLFWCSVKLQHIVFNISTCLNVLGCCHVIGWLAFCV